MPVGAGGVLDRLIAEGLVQPAAQSKRDAGRPMTAKGRISDLVVDQRR